MVVSVVKKERQRFQVPSVIRWSSPPRAYPKGGRSFRERPAIWEGDQSRNFKPRFAMQCGKPESARDD
jgi:hypothetical protein